MVNTDDFIKRLEYILDYYSLNASSFADKIGVQRSSLSHLLSGRNKPSLDFILKIMDVFPEVDLYWILNGKGTFPKSEIENEVNRVQPTPTFNNAIVETKIEKQTDLFSEKNSNAKNKTEENLPNLFSNSKLASINKTEVEIDRIVIFYTNGTFKTYSAE
ncbi:helix-turn-helix domain-containing protein [Flavobacterium franklandianum]|uniref:Helix-turn-helix transcriptional regulator n=1 Tax=Flavobacterium franklandianum TaxID=2594430 RepID=A0A553C6M4_9FLAO|nr:helix-turn-helix transcriptional regulator [Flavobacterium franklandianum]TRX16179.1 helix-turn-helix transcriptional regulator [Flavobacterium franklandianum]